MKIAPVFAGKRCRLKPGQHALAGQAFGVRLVVPALAGPEHQSYSRLLYPIAAASGYKSRLTFVC